MVAFGSHYYMTTGCYLYKEQNISYMTTMIILGILQLCTIFLIARSSYKDGYAKGVRNTIESIRKYTKEDKQ